MPIFSLSSTGCGGTFSNGTGVLSSPFFPENYPPGQDCVYSISQPNGTFITLITKSMGINCSGSDSIELRDGNSENSPIIGRYCGSEANIPLSIQTTQEYLWMRFKSDYGGSGYGFNMSYSSSNRSQWSFNSGSCGASFDTPSGLITSPSYPRSYPAIKDCIYSVTLPTGSYAGITIISMDIPCHTDGTEWIEITDGNGNGNDSKVMGKWCGSGAPIPSHVPIHMHSTQNELKIRFKSNDIESGLGFQIEYNALISAHTCGGNYNNASGLLTSPSYPNPYPDNADCLFIISQPNITHVNFTVINMDIECKETFSTSDYLEVWDGDGVSNNSLKIGTWCGNGSSIPTFVLVTQNFLSVRWE